MASNNNKHFIVKYLECRHNYAARSNGYELDGCGEFCPTSAPETLESFICAACHCHRNFHRKVEVEVLIISSTKTICIPLIIMDDPPPQYTMKPRAQLGETFENNNVGAEREMEMDGGEIKVR
ncbi:hypothetical protein H5410_026912 [Solanum commersonii]|uniref:ZF-HD dimerization-type domain-containing protein n=1 Tax=Solanum commersonii TaxID=4109 RepID=A0A9J5Z201_SOLCO|nr:hypothetical protein H5410_026912 [Solanum commersonii]